MQVPLWIKQLPDAPSSQRFPKDVWRMLKLATVVNCSRQRCVIEFEKADLPRPADSADQLVEQRYSRENSKVHMRTLIIHHSLPLDMCAKRS